MLSMAGAVILLGLSLGLERKNKVMANGILSGGLFTLVYGVTHGFGSRDTTTRFITLTVAHAWLSPGILAGIVESRDPAGCPPDIP